MPTYFIGFLFVQHHNDTVFLNGITEDEFFDIMQKYYEDHDESEYIDPDDEYEFRRQYVQWINYTKCSIEYSFVSEEQYEEFMFLTNLFRSGDLKPEFPKYYKDILKIHNITAKYDSDEDQAAKTILSDKHYIKIPGMLPCDKHYFMFDEIPDNLTFYFESSYAF